MRREIRLTALFAAVTALLFAMPTLAQDSAADAAGETSASDVEIIEEIVVTGFRRSLENALNSKRFSESISDSIFAEDVGKSTDQNIADALSRVTGVTVQEEDGEGTRVSVRGTGPSMNQIQMNGVALTSGLSGDQGNNPTADQSVDLSSFASDILSSINVVKTASADQDEGSLGATIVLRTIRPLSLNAPRRSANIEARTSDYTGEYDGRATLSLADKFADGTFGYVFTAAMDNQTTRQDRIGTNWVAQALPIVDLFAGAGRTAHDIATGNAIRVLGEGQTEADLVNWDPATQIAVQGPLDVLARNNTDISTTANERDRLSASAGFEWQPTDATNLRVDYTRTQQDVKTDYHNFRLNFAPIANLSSADPITEWNGVNLDTRTLESSYSRSSSGFFNRTQGDRELTTNLASLDLTHEFNSRFRGNLLAGFSTTTDETKNHIGLTTATWGTIGNTFVETLPPELVEPVGYDCTAGGGDCSYAMSTSLAVFDPFDGRVVSASGKWNPFDLYANHLGGLRWRRNDQSDDNLSVHLDFEYDLDWGFATTLQFGVKYAEREKDVHTQNQTALNNTALFDTSDPSIVYSPTAGMQSINLIDMLSGEAFPYDDFAEDLTDDRSNAFFGGWPMLDANRAIQAYIGRDPGSVQDATNLQGTRNIETETNAAFVKLDFEGMEGRLTGNIGLRLVQDKNTASGYGGITFQRSSWMFDPYDLLVVRGLANIEGSEPCPEPILGINPNNGLPSPQYTPQNDAELRGCWDWAITHGYDYTNDNTIPYVDGQWVLPGGIDTNRLVWVDYSGETPVVRETLPLPAMLVDANGNLVPSNNRLYVDFRGASETWQYQDRSTTFTGPNGNVPQTWQREAQTSGTAKHTLLLPSLNVNFATNENMIVRFAVSRTMTRPAFDSLNPRLNINENVWGLTAIGSAGNAALKPLKSTNLDVSWEWYFNDSGLLSVALFHKDMKDFLERVDTPFHYRDVRTEYELEDANLLLPYDENRVPGDADGCMPDRVVGGFITTGLLVQCHTALIAIERNGQGAEVQGIEIGYTQNYDFLPGIWSGLGINFNYTFQNSEKDPEEIGTTGIFTKPLPQAFTPRHSANTTLFYEKHGLTLRLAHRYAGTQLVDDGIAGVAIWQESTYRLDFSARYQVTDNISASFQVTNVTDEVWRHYVTAYNLQNTAGEVVYDEGNVFDDDVDKSRTRAVFKNGTQYRLGIRVTF